MKNLIFLFLMSFSFVAAQRVVMNDDVATKPVHNFENNHGFAFKFNNGGISVAGSYQKALNPTTAILGEISIRSEKDEQEQKLYNYFGEVVIPNKYNYMMAVPLEVGIHKRLFADKVDESFRPFVEVSAGPQVAILSPYFKDLNANAQLNNNEQTFDPLGAIKYAKFQVGVGGSLNVGIAFGKSKKNLQSMRFGMSVSHYQKAIELMEPSFKAGQKTFYSPSIVLVFGKIRK